MHREVIMGCCAGILMQSWQAFANTESEIRLPPFERYKVLGKATITNEWHSSYSAALDDHRLFAENYFERCLETGAVRELHSCEKPVFTTASPSPSAVFYNGKPSQIHQKGRMYIEIWSGAENKLIDSLLTEESVAATVTIDMRLYCPDGATLIQKEISSGNYDVYCRSTTGCPAPYVANPSSGLCEAYCTTGEIWNTATERCDPPPQEQNCGSHTANPIDLLQGQKYRTEPVLSAGLRYPFSLTYSFNNHRNQERTPVGSKIAVVSGDRYVAATKPPMTASEYEASYTSRGVPINSTIYRSSQRYGSVDQYWRHSFDEVLLIQGSQYRFQPANGEEIVFAGLRSSAAYPALSLAALASGEESFSGYKLVNRKTREIKKFNSNGRLIKIERSPQDILNLTYDDQHRLSRITNSEGAYIQLAYQELVTDSIYSTTSTRHAYPVSAANNRGESTQITWGKSYQGRIGKFHLITQIAEATSGAAKSARTFEYNDARWPASITDQYFVADIANAGSRRKTLHFEYDALGRAVFSGLEGRSSDTVSYVDANTRVVTNALGKQATYKFADFNGVKRLQSVTGEPTQNCVSSEVAYHYDTKGNISRKVQNGQVTEYLYDSRNREISRTEAAGTLQARTITTQYHATLNVPIKITEPGLVTDMTYDTEGRLLTTKKTASAQ